MRPGFIDLFDDVVGVRVRSSCVCVCVDIRNTAQERENKKRASRYCRAWDIQFAGGCIYFSPNSLICTHHTHNWVWSPVNTQTHTHTHSTHSVSSLLGVDLISSALFIYYLYIFALSFVIFSVLPYPYIHQTHTHTQKNNANENKKNPKNMARGMAGSIGRTEWSPHFQPHPSTTQCCCI
jgi:hypothetical protein